MRDMRIGTGTSCCFGVWSRAIIIGLNVYLLYGTFVGGG